MDRDRNRDRRAAADEGEAMSAADQNILAQLGLRPDPNQEAAAQSSIDPKTGVSIAQDPFQQLQPNSVPHLDIPLPVTGPPQTLGSRQQQPGGVDLSRDPFDTHTSPGEADRIRQQQEHAAAGITVAGVKLPSLPSPGSLPMTEGTRYNPQGQPIGFTIAPPITIQDSQPAPEGAGYAPNVGQPGAPPILLTPLPEGMRDPQQPGVSRPALGDPQTVARSPGGGLSDPVSYAPQTEEQKFTELLHKSGSGGSTVVTGTGAAAGAVDFVPLAAAMLLAFLVLRHS
jgi:hypothetical protein